MTTEQMRAEFEAWAQPEGFPLSRIGQRYEFTETRDAWAGWQACASVRQQRIDLLRVLLQRVTHELHDLVKDERDDPSVGITGWDSVHESVRLARAALSATKPEQPVYQTERSGDGATKELT